MDITPRNLGGDFCHASPSNPPPRSLGLLTLGRLEPITRLQGRDFIEAWIQCIHNHYALWQRGFRRRDLNLSCFMLARAEGRAIAVQNDWDLCVLVDEPQSARECASTTEFLAGELLDERYWRGKIQVLYRHDLESFVWILLWVLVCFHEGKETVPANLKEWQTAEYRRCRGSRLLFLLDLPTFHVPPSWTTEWPILIHLRPWVRAKNVDDLAVAEPTNATIRAQFMGLLEEASKHDGLEYLCTLEP
ncbi:hypothetical protein BDV93DRAFT_499913 [Ceratobasidium sp. AG-I]|nr:hypothetical protein BDV93DRAFT_499913 [Ceratobasidium sp. AG-I]